MTAMPLYDSDSICSMSLTVVVYARSLFETIRCSISCGSNPLKFQMIAMTGMLTTGKMSTGVRKIDSTPRIRISIDITMKVYGCLSASRTIHIFLASLVPAVSFNTKQCSLNTDDGVSFFHFVAGFISLLHESIRLGVTHFLTHFKQIPAISDN